MSVTGSGNEFVYLVTLLSDLTTTSASSDDQNEDDRDEEEKEDDEDSANNSISSITDEPTPSTSEPMPSTSQSGDLTSSAEAQTSSESDTEILPPTKRMKNDVSVKMIILSRNVAVFLFLGLPQLHLYASKKKPVTV